MTTSRRDFLVAGSSALALSALPARTLAQATTADARAAMPHRQRIALRELVAELSTSAPEIDLGSIARLL